MFVEISKMWVKISNFIRYSFKCSLKIDQDLRNFDKNKILHPKTGLGGRGLFCILFCNHSRLKKIVTIHLIIWTRRKVTFSSKIDPKCLIMW